MKKYYIFYYVWINHYRNNSSRSEILIKLVLTKYNNNLKDWDINRIKQVEKIYGKVSKNIQY